MHSQIEALKGAGVTEVVLAINHQQPEVHTFIVLNNDTITIEILPCHPPSPCVFGITQVMLNFVKEYEKKLEIKITFSQETEPLGTAGPLALARDKLVDESGQPFFVLNSDVICEYPLLEMIEFHKTNRAEASIMVTEVVKQEHFLHFVKFIFHLLIAFSDINRLMILLSMVWWLQRKVQRELKVLSRNRNILWGTRSTLGYTS